MYIFHRGVGAGRLWHIKPRIVASSRPPAHCRSFRRSRYAGRGWGGSGDRDAAGRALTATNCCRAGVQRESQFLMTVEVPQLLPPGPPVLQSYGPIKNL